MAHRPDRGARDVTVTALVSGGKDSIFAASLADAQGWTVDELLTLVPSDPESLMFHTPNLDLVALQAEAWGKRHRRVELLGRGEPAEEAALEAALGVGGPGPIVAGAIASSYQFTRLVRVADRIGRRVYAPLWGKAGDRVLRAEVEAGLEIRFVHLSAEGLPERWLGARLTARIAEELIGRSLGPRGVHPAGEGGEFETLVVDAPFFSARIAIDSARPTVTHDVARLEVVAAHLEPKRPPTPDRGA